MGRKKIFFFLHHGKKTNWDERTLPSRKTNNKGKDRKEVEEIKELWIK